ncbi:hypothetical protein [Methanosarcina sp.]|uniref:hypothetical protein n=1 Tax=Methanosarcina sp. TaxID=2213 RepID=UPI002989348B|nr:hypothetical protein [Methanosarcina sp.]MDW5550478.1 hypothetical protein [Methanosarcina sp.]MDW5554884.1 hypothetical protein [Methanosarcina sp.]MDW5559899.1 hypothetical protein [Methanosarcina sp.]
MILRLPALAMIFVGLVSTSIFVEFGLIHKFSRTVSPIFAYTNLPDICALTYLVSIGSLVATNRCFSRQKGKLPGE